MSSISSIFDDITFYLQPDLERWSISGDVRYSVAGGVLKRPNVMGSSDVVSGDATQHKYLPTLYDTLVKSTSRLASSRFTVPYAREFDTGRYSALARSYFQKRLSPWKLVLLPPHCAPPGYICWFGLNLDLLLCLSDACYQALVSCPSPSPGERLFAGEICTLGHG